MIPTSLPFVSKLKENGKHVIGLGMKQSTSDLLASNCDEFIFYEDLEKQPAPASLGPQAVDIPPEKKEVFDLLLESIAALIRENKDPIFASMVKDTRRKKPSFNESAYGYRSFSNLLVDAEKRRLHHAPPGQEGRVDVRHRRVRGVGGCCSSCAQTACATLYNNPRPPPHRLFWPRRPRGSFVIACTGIYRSSCAQKPVRLLRGKSLTLLFTFFLPPPWGRLSLVLAAPWAALACR